MSATDAGGLPMMKRLGAFGWTVLVLAIGLAGTVAIIAIAGSVVDSQTKVRLLSGPSVSTDGWEQGYVSAEGTLTIDNARSLSPIQTSIIRCYRDEKSCTEATARIAYGEWLHVDLSRHKISVWNDTTILFHQDDRCMEYVYTIDRANKRLVAIMELVEGPVSFVDTRNKQA